ncbi:MAG: hypothetical protein FJ215_11995 [Ignavibacteria bacterium]|nr:hypothetical protein [Ignavibacteria bacterium]
MTLAFALLLIITAIGIIVYWIDFFRRGRVHVVKDDWYIRFERAFCLADLWMAACAITGAIGLLTQQSFGPVFGLLTASALIFLAIIDVTFNVQNHLYRRNARSASMKFEIFINIWSLGFGSALIIFLEPMILLV